MAASTTNPTGFIINKFCIAEAEPTAPVDDILTRLAKNQLTDDNKVARAVLLAVPRQFTPPTPVGDNMVCLPAKGLKHEDYKFFAYGPEKHAKAVVGAYLTLQFSTGKVKGAGHTFHVAPYGEEMVALGGTTVEGFFALSFGGCSNKKDITPADEKNPNVEEAQVNVSKNTVKRETDEEVYLNDGEEELTLLDINFAKSRMVEICGVFVKLAPNFHANWIRVHPFGALLAAAEAGPKDLTEHTSIFIYKTKKDAAGRKVLKYVNGEWVEIDVGKWGYPSRFDTIAAGHRDTTAPGQDDNNSWVGCEFDIRKELAKASTD